MNDAFQLTLILVKYFQCLNILPYYLSVVPMNVVIDLCSWVAYGESEIAMVQVGYFFVYPEWITVIFIIKNRCQRESLKDGHNSFRCDL